MLSVNGFDGKAVGAIWAIIVVGCAMWWQQVLVVPALKQGLRWLGRMLFWPLGAAITYNVVPVWAVGYNGQHRA